MDKVSSHKCKGRRKFLLIMRGVKNSLVSTFREEDSSLNFMVSTCFLLQKGYVAISIKKRNLTAVSAVYTNFCFFVVSGSFLTNINK